MVDTVYDGMKYNFLYVERLPTLFLPDREDQTLLQNLVILDPAWLISVMKAIMELHRRSKGDLNLIIRLQETGIASKSLLREKWADFISESEPDISFRQLCLMLQAYCLIFPLKEFKSQRKPEISSSYDVNEETFLVPSMLPEKVEEDEVDCDIPWAVFYFNFDNFLPEDIYHRLICIMLANTEDHSSVEVMPKFSKLWSCFYDIDESHWKFEFQRDYHKLKVSIQ